MPRKAAPGPRKGQGVDSRGRPGPGTLVCIIEVGGPDFRIWGTASPLAICGGKCQPVLEMGLAWTRGGGPHLEMGPSSTRGSGPGPASVGKGKPWPSHSLFLKENAPPTDKKLSDDARKDHETVFFLEREARKESRDIIFSRAGSPGTKFGFRDRAVPLAICRGKRPPAPTPTKK